MPVNQPDLVARPPAAFMLRLLLVAWAVWSLWVAAMSFINLSMAGFPDGHLTPYDLATNGPLGIASWLTVVSGGYFLVRGLRGRKLAWTAMIVQVAIAAILTIAPIWVLDICPRWDLCGRAYQSVTGTFIDDGAGG